MRLAPLAVAGSGAGAVLLLLTPAGVFARTVPFLVAFAALALLVQPWLSAWLEKHPGKGGRLRAPYGLLAVWVFDGYRGVGAGVMALAVLTLAAETHLARANALKNVLPGVADLACSIVFVLYGSRPLGSGGAAGVRGPGRQQGRTFADPADTRRHSPHRGRADRTRACGAPMAQPGLALVSKAARTGK